MPTVRYNKLVRDRIPEIIERSGKTCTVAELDLPDYLNMLDAKLNEELADLLEVIRAVAAARGSSIGEVEKIRQEKAAERGGFEKRILLIEVRSEEK